MEELLYHKTNKNNLPNIEKNGLKRTIGKNSIYAGEQKAILCFSEGVDGVLLMTAILSYGTKLNIAEYLKTLENDRILVFDKLDVKNERNYVDGRTTTNDIPANKLRMLEIKNNKTGAINSSALEVISYMMSKINPVDEQKLKQSLGNIPLNMKEEKIKTITELYNQMYEANKTRIEKYKKADYKLTSTHEITKEFNRDIED